MSASKSRRERPVMSVPYAASLEIFQPHQGQEYSDSLPLELEVSLGRQDFTDDDGFGFSLSFRQVFLDVSVRGCEILREGRYVRTVSKEDFSQYIKKFYETSSAASGGVTAGISSKIANLLASIGIDIAAQAQIKRALEQGEIKTLENSIDFKIVEWVGNGRWKIGHPRIGDPLQLDGSLQGAYLSPTGDGRTGSETNELCRLDPQHASNYSVSIELRAPKAACVYRPLGDLGTNETWAAKNKARIERVLALKMLQEKNRADGLSPPMDEVILARGRLIVSKRK